MADNICYIGSTTNYIGSTEDFIGCGSPQEKGREFTLFRNGVKVAQMTTTSLSLSGTIVDTTNKDSGGFRELTPEAGTTAMSLGASGIFIDVQVLLDVMDDCLTKVIGPYEIHYEYNNRVVSGNFQVTSFENSGEKDGAVEYTISLESSGTVTRV